MTSSTSSFIGAGQSGEALPPGSPVGSTPAPLSPQASRSNGASRATNTPSLSSSAGRTASRPGRVGSRQLVRLKAELSERDMEILRRVAEHRYLSTSQLQGFCFAGHASDDSAARTTRRVLARLQRHGLVRPLLRRIGGVRSGSSTTIWQLSPAGARVLRGAGDKHRTHEPSARFLGHCLAIADVHLAARSLRAGVERVEVQVEPFSWRRYAGPGGETRWLQPDLHVEVVTADFRDRWFIEVDCGTESLPTLLRKCEQYEAYKRAGIEQVEHAFPLVLWAMGGQRADERIDRLRRALGRTATFTPGLYRVARLSDATDVLGGVL